MKKDDGKKRLGLSPSLKKTPSEKKKSFRSNVSTTKKEPDNAPAPIRPVSPPPKTGTTTEKKPEKAPSKVPDSKPLPVPVQKDLKNSRKQKPEVELDPESDSEPSNPIPQPKVFANLAARSTDGPTILLDVPVPVAKLKFDRKVMHSMEIFDPLNFDWVFLSPETDVNEEKTKFYEDNKESMKESGHLLIIVPNEEINVSRWWVFLLDKKHPDPEDKPMLQVSQQQQPKGPKEVDVNPGSLLHTLLEACRKNLGELPRDESMLITNAVYEEIGAVKRVPDYRPLLWTSKDLAEYIKLTQTLQEDCTEEGACDVCHQLKRGNNMALTLALSMVNKCNFSDAISEERLSQMVQELVPLANCGSVELFRKILSKLMDHHSSSTFSVSFSILEGIAYLLRTGACNVYSWKGVEDHKAALLAEIGSVWLYLQTSYQDSISVDNELVLYYQLTILTALCDFAVVLNMNKMKADFAASIGDYFGKYTGTYQTYDMEFLAKYYQQAMSQIGTDKTQAEIWSEKFNVLVNCVASVKDFITFQWDGTSIQNVLEFCKLGLAAAEGLAETFSTFVDLPSAWYPRIRFIRDMLDRLDGPQFSEMFAKKESIDEFCSLLLSKYDKARPISTESMDEFYAILMHLEKRVTDGDIKVVKVGISFLGIIEDKIQKNLSESKQVLTQKLESVYTLAQNHVEKQEETLNMAASSKKGADKSAVKKTGTEDSWTSLKEELAQRPASQQTEKNPELAVNVVPKLPEAPQDDNLYLQYDPTFTSVFYCYRKIGSPDPVRGKIDSKKCSDEELEALGLLKVVMDKSLPVSSEAGKYSPYMLFVTSEGDTIKICYFNEKKEYKLQKISLRDLDLNPPAKKGGILSKLIPGAQRNLLDEGLILTLYKKNYIPELKQLLEKAHDIKGHAKDILITCISGQSAGIIERLKKQGQRLWVNVNEFRGKNIEKQALRLTKPQLLKDSANQSVLVETYKNEFRLEYDIEQMILSQKIELRGENDLSGIGQEIAGYIPAKATHSHLANPEPEDLHELDDEVQNFLDDDNERMFLLQADSGMGKSLFLRYMEEKLWQKYNLVKGHDSTIPLYVPLASLPDPNYRCVEQVLEQKDWDSTSIQRLKNRLSNAPKVVVLLDGYDEINTKRNIVESNKIGDWRDSKIFLTSRLGYTDSSSYQNYFSQQRPDEKDSFVRDRYLAPFTGDQQKDYLTKYIDREKKFSQRKSGQDEWTVDRFQQKFNDVETLNQLAKNPFLLSILVKVLPELKDDQNVTRAKVFYQFLNYWFRVALFRLEKQNLPARYDLKGSFFNYTQELAKALWLENRVAITYKRPGFKNTSYHTSTDWGQFFYNEDAERGLKGAPVRIVNNKVRMIHKSVQEYAVAFCLYRSLKSFLKRWIREKQTGEDKVPPLPEVHIFNQKSLSNDPEIVDLLKELVEGDDKTEEWRILLLGFVWQTRDTEQGALVKIAAANSMTLMIAMGLSFSYEDLSGTKIGGSVLDGGNFFSTNFSNADLRGVRLARAYLAKADFTGAIMDDIDLEALPGLEWEDVMDRVITIKKDANSEEISHYVVQGEGKGFIINIATMQSAAFVGNYRTHEVERKRIWTSSKKIQALCWDLTQDTLKPKIYTGPKKGIEKIIASPDGKRLFALDAIDLCYWDLTQPKTVSVILTGNKKRIYNLAIYPDGAMYSCGYEGEVFYWDLNFPGEGIPYTGAKGTIYNLIITPDRRHMFAKNDKQLIFYWDLGQNIHEARQIAKGYELEISADKQHIYVGGDKGEVIGWDLSQPIGTPTKFIGPTEDIVDLVFSPDGKKLFAISGKEREGKEIHYWDLTTENLIGTKLTGPKKVIEELQFSPNGKIVFSFSENFMEVYGWDITQPEQTEGEYILKPSGEKSVFDTKDTPDWKLGEGDKGVHLWNKRSPPDSLKVITLEDQKGLAAFVISKDSKSVAIGNDSGIVNFYDIDKPTQPRQLAAERGEILHLSYDPKNDKCIRIISARGLKQLDMEKISSLRITHADHKTTIKNIEYSLKGEVAFTLSEGEYALWHIETGDMLTKDKIAEEYRLPNVHFYHEDGDPRKDEHYRVGYSKYIEKHLTEVTARLDKKSNKSEISWARVVQDAVFISDKVLCLALSAKYMLLFDLTPDRPLQPVKLSGIPNSVGELILSKDGRTLYTLFKKLTDSKQQLWSWDLSQYPPQGTQVITLDEVAHDHLMVDDNCPGWVVAGTDPQDDDDDDDDDKPKKPKVEKIFNLWPYNVNTGRWSTLPRTGPKDSFYQVVVDPEGRRMVSKGGDAELVYWDLTVEATDGVRLTGPKKDLNEIYISSDAQLLFCCGDEGVFYWNLPDPKGIKLTGPTDYIWMLAFSSNYRKVFSAGNKGQVFQWDISQGQTVGTRLTGLKKEVYKIHVSRDERIVFASAEEGEFCFWDISKNQTEGTALTGQKLEIKEFLFTPNGRWLFTGGEDGEVFAWDLTQLHQPGIRFYGPAKNINKLLLSPDGATLFATESSGVIYCYDVTNIHQKKTHKGVDLYTVPRWPPVYETDPTHSRSIVVQKKTLTVYDHDQKFQTLSFPSEITAYKLSPDGQSIMVAADKASFCWKLRQVKEKKKYSLIWDNGDELFCHKAKICNCKGLSPINQRVLEQYGAIVVQPDPSIESTVTQAISLPEVKILQQKLSTLYQKKKEIEKTREQLDTEIDDINQKLLGFYLSQDGSESQALLQPPPPAQNQSPPPAAEKPPPPAVQKPPPPAVQKPPAPPPPAAKTPAKKEPEYEIDPELAKLLAEINSPPAAPAEEEMDPELAALLKSLNT